MDAYDWRARCARVKRMKRPQFNWADSLRAETWNRCAVGTQHKKLPEVVVYINPQDSNLHPADEVLFRLGQEFYIAVRDDEVQEAEDILDRIDDRVLELKREQKEK